MSSSRNLNPATRQIVTVLVLLVLLLAMAVSYFLLTRPPRIEGQGERDRKFLFSIYGFEGDLLRRPSGACFDMAGNIYVADTGKRRVVVFDSDGKYLRSFGEAGKEAKQLWTPLDVAVTPDGRAFVVDSTGSKLVEYDTRGRAVRDITVEERPISVTVANDNLFVTTDSGVLIASLRGELLTGYVKRGKELGSFDRPAGVAVDPEDGTLYVADSLNYRVQAIATNGKTKWAYGKPIPADQAIQYNGKDRKFGLPASIAVDENGLIYVVDGVNHEIQVLDREGEFIEKIGDIGHEDGTFYYPDGIDYRDGRIVVADKYNDRVSVFSTPLPPGQQWRAYVPYALALLLLPLLLLPLFARRRRTYVVTPEFVTLLAADDQRNVIADALHRVTVTPELAVTGKEIEGLKLNWVERDPADADVTELAERFGLATEQAEALAIAKSLKGKRVLIAESDELRKAGQELEVPVVTYEEIKRTLVKDTAPAAPAAAQAEEE